MFFSVFWGKNMKRQLLTRLGILIVGTAAFVPVYANLNIVANYDKSITGLTDASNVMNDINSAINFYDSTITNNVNVYITFSNMTGGLGQSNTQYDFQTYTDLHATLITNSSGDSIDTQALAQLNSNPYTSSTNLGLTTANGKALGFSETTSGSNPDSIIGLNTSLTFTNHNSPISGKYDLYAIASHEIDEALGTSSGVGGLQTIADLYRYDGNGHRSFTTDTTQHAYFSVNGTSKIDTYNQFGHTNGDYGDWAVQSPAQVQDWQGTPGVTINLGPGEIGLLDAVGWNIKAQAVPAPNPLLFLTLLSGVGILVTRKRRV